MAKQTSLADRLKELRTEKDITQVELAEKSGVPRGTLSQWEAGRKIGNVNKLIALAQYFGVSVDYLIGIED